MPITNQNIVAKIIGYGSYLPEQILTNNDLALSLDTSDEWIFTRTGIRHRRIAAPNQLTSDLASIALQNALEISKITSNDLDYIILATTTPDLIMPATAIRVQQLVGATKAAAFDIQAVCSGFLYGLTIANSMIKSGQANTVAIIGAEIMSRILDWSDRKTCVLFGDGAGAMILQREERLIEQKSPQSYNNTLEQSLPGIEAAKLISCPELQEALCVPGGVATGNLEAKLYMEGSTVFRHAVENMTSLINDILKDNNHTCADITWVLSHQANIRILQAIAERLNVPLSKFIATIENHANTSAASIPLAFDEYMREGLLQKGQLIVLVSAGAGMTFGAMLIRL